MNVPQVLALHFICLLVLIPVKSYAQSEPLTSPVDVYELDYNGRKFTIPYVISSGELERIELRNGSLAITVDTRTESGSAEFSMPYELFKLFWKHIAGSEDALEGLVVMADNNSVHHELTLMGARNTIGFELPAGSRTIEISSVILPAKRPEMTLHSSSLWVSPGEELKISGTLSNLDNVADISIDLKVRDAQGRFIFSDNNTRTDVNGDFVASVMIPEDSTGGLFTISAIPSLQNVPRLEGRDAFYVKAEPSLYSIRSDGVEEAYQVSSTSAFYEPYFLRNAKILGLLVSGASGTGGMASIVFRHSLLGGDLKMLDGAPATSSLRSNSTHSMVDIEYRHDSSIQHFDVAGTTAIPEFGAHTLIALTAIMAIVLVLMRVRITKGRRRMI